MKGEGAVPVTAPIGREGRSQAGAGERVAGKTGCRTNRRRGEGPGVQGQCREEERETHTSTTSTSSLHTWTVAAAVTKILRRSLLSVFTS